MALSKLISIYLFYQLFVIKVYTDYAGTTYISGCTIVVKLFPGLFLNLLLFLTSSLFLLLIVVSETSGHERKLSLSRYLPSPSRHFLLIC